MVWREFESSVCRLTERLNVSYRQRKDELEQRMSSLQESRRELMVQLEGLMKLLKVMNAALLRRVGWRSVPPTAACLSLQPPPPALVQPEPFGCLASASA